MGEGVNVTITSSSKESSSLFYSSIALDVDTNKLGSYTVTYSVYIILCMQHIF